MTPVFHGIEGTALPIGNRPIIYRLTNHSLCLLSELTEKVKRNYDTYWYFALGLLALHWLCFPRILECMNFFREKRAASLALLGLFALTVFAYCFNVLKEPDAYYHLQAGRVIWTTHAIPHTDIFSYTAAGASWVAHEWLAQLAFYGTYALVGYWGLIAAVALMGVLTILLVTRIAHRASVPLSFTLSAVLLLSYLELELWIARPQIFAFLFCAFLVFLLERYRRAPRITELVGMVLLLLVWANMHASFVLGLVLIAWYTMGSALMRAWPVFGTAKLSTRDVVRLAGTFGIASVVCLINPTGYHAFVYWRAVQPVAEAFRIFEWRSILAFTGLTHVRFQIALFGLSALLASYWYGYRKVSRDLTSLGMVAGITILPFISIRHVGFWAVAVIPFAVPALGMLLKPYLERVANRVLVGVLVSFCVLLVVIRAFSLPTTYFAPHRIPVYAVDFIERVGLKGPLFNLYNEGGYLIWRLWPNEKVAIDGRSEVYVGKPLEDYFGIMRGGNQWDRLVNDTYHINYFFLAYNPSELRKNIAPVVNRLRKDGWVPIYWDDVIVIYVRNAPENKALIDQYGLRVIDPFSDPTKIPAAQSKAAADEFKRVTESSPMNLVSLEYARRFLLSR